MKRSAEQIVLSIEAEEARIGTLRVEQIRLDREIQELKANLKRLAERSPDGELLFWLENQEARLEKSWWETAVALMKAEKSQMKIVKPRTREEALARLEHQEALTELARKKVELHIKFLETTRGLLRQKIAEIEGAPKAN